MDAETEIIKERLDLAALVGEYVQLKRAGQHFKGLCPFHNEKTPSFIVSPTKGIWHCFGCFPPGQKVKTPFGFHNIESIDAKHYVVSDAGHIRKVLATHAREYQGDLMTIRLRKLTYPVSLTTDHNVFVVRGASYTRQYKNFAKRYRQYLRYLNNGQTERYFRKTQKYFPIQKLPAGEIQKGDYLLYPIDQTVENQETIDLGIYLDRKPRFGPRPPKIALTIPVTDDLLRLIGLYVAEGSNHRAYIRFSLGNHEEELAQEIVSLIQKIFALPAAIHRRSGQKSGIEISVCHSHLATIFGNLVGKGAENKHIPFAFQRLPFPKQKMLLEGIYSGDGTSFVANKSARTHRSITTISRVLAEQITDILLRGSIYPNVSIGQEKEDGRGVHHRESYTISWSDEGAARYDLVYYTGREKYWLLPILSLERQAYRGPVYNLTVDEDHSYVTSSFAVANCGEGGDVFSFVQRVEGIEFPAALQLLAERAGVTLQTRQRQATGQRERLLALLDETARFYQEILLRQTAGKRARDYLIERGIEQQTMELFRIGYAPVQWDLLQQFLRKKGYAPAEMVAAGVVGKNEQGKMFDRFRGRIMFPIADLQGRTVAFGGRIAPWHTTGNEGKYINSPETALYEKRRTVYNLHRAKRMLRPETACLVVEGYMDAVLTAQAGIEGVVASSGTAFTAEQIGLIGRFTKMLHFCFDADAAGFKAAQAATREALAAGMRVAVIPLPAGKDPADLAHEDPEQLRVLVQQPRSLVSVLLERLKQSPAGVQKDALLADAVPLMRFVANPIHQGEMVQEVAEAVHVSEERIMALLRQAPMTVSTAAPESDEAAVPGGRQSAAERQLLGLFMLDPTLRASLFPRLKLEWLLDPSSIGLYKQFHTLADSNADFFVMPVDALLQSLPAEHLAFAEAVRQVSEESWRLSNDSPDREGQQLIRFLQRRWLEQELSARQRQLAEADAAERERLLGEFQALAQQLVQVTEQAA